MRANEAVYAIYRFNNNDEFLSTESRYHISYLFTPQGLISDDDIRKIRPEHSEESELTFHTKDELTEFCYRLIESLRISSVYLLNTTDFNIGIEGSNDLMSFRQIFHKYGLKIDLHKDSKGVLGKFF